MCTLYSFISWVDQVLGGATDAAELSHGVDNGGTNNYRGNKGKTKCT